FVTSYLDLRDAEVELTDEKDGAWAEGKAPIVLITKVRWLHQQEHATDEGSGDDNTDDDSSDEDSTDNEDDEHPDDAAAAEALATEHARDVEL
ncbi:hypothetical protein DYB31_006716, partial [Aphanomyces astaci]